MSTPQLFDLPDQEIGEAVDAAIEISAFEPERARAWEALDRVLRARTVRWLQDRDGDPDVLARAIGRAARAAGSPWLERWHYLLEILRDGRQTPPSPFYLALFFQSSPLVAWVFRHVVRLAPVQREGIVRAILEEKSKPECAWVISHEDLDGALLRLEQSRLLVRGVRLDGITTWLLTWEGRQAQGLLGNRP